MRITEQGEDHAAETEVYPSLMNRLQAMFFDSCIIMVISMFLLVNLFDLYAEQQAGMKILVFFVIVMIYDPIGSMTGGTIGYRTMGLTVRRSDGISKISLIQAYKRSFVKVLLGSVSFITVGRDKQNKALHDKAADTLVVYKSKA